MKNELVLRIRNRYKAFRIVTFIVAILIVPISLFLIREELTFLTEQQLNLGIFIGVFVLLIASLGLYFSLNLSLTLKETGIEQRTLFSSRFIPYSEIERIIIKTDPKSNLSPTWVKKNELLIDHTFTNIIEAIGYLSDKGVEIVR